MVSLRFIALWALLLFARTAWAADAGLHISLGDSPQESMGAALKMVGLLTVVSVAPAILLTTTSFLRIIVVLSFLRQALGLQNTPPTQILIGLALFLTAAIMAPVGTRVYDGGVAPYLEGRMAARDAFENSAQPVREFMLRYTRDADLELFYEINEQARPSERDDVKLHLLIPAFIISELRTAFEMGFLLFVPFLLLDLIVSSVLMSIGMVMLPPIMISLPLKLLLFVLVDGWNLVVGSMVAGFS